LVFFLASSWAVAVVETHDYLRAPPFAEESNIAIHVARGEGFGNPMDPSTRPAPTSWSPPLYPYLMASVFRIHGIRTPASTVVLMVFNALCFGAVVAGARVLGRCAFSPAAGSLAAVLIALHPSFLFFVGRYWDMYLALALFVWILILAEGCTQPILGATLGLGLGLLSLTNASYLLTYPLILWRAVRRQSPAMRLKTLGCSLIVFCIVLTPWTVRNAMTFGRLMYVRGGAEFELWLGNLPSASGLINDATLAQHPFVNPAQRQLLVGIGEMQYFRRCRLAFEREIATNPLRFLRLCALRSGYLFIGDPDPIRTDVPPFLAGYICGGIMIDKLTLNSLTALLGVGGALLAWRRRRGSMWLIALGFLAVTPFIVTSVTDRYLLPLWTIFLLFAGFLISSAWGSGRHS
jgi:hypothetical protein